MGISLFLRDGQQDQKIQGLHRTIKHRRDSEGSEFAVLLGDKHASKRQGVIRPALLKLLECLHLLLVGGPSNPVHPGRSGALVCGDTSDGQRSGRQRAGQNILQGSRLSELPIPDSLRDASLELLNLLLVLRPWNVGPGVEGEGRGSTRPVRSSHLPFPRLKVRQ